LQEHLARLEERIVLLRKELRDPNILEYQRSERELALKNAEEALRLLRRAYELEQKTV